MQYNKLSRFVQEIPPYLLDKGKSTGHSSVGAGSFGGFGGSSSYGGKRYGAGSGSENGRGGMSAAELFGSNIFDKPRGSSSSFGNSSKPSLSAMTTAKTLMKGNEISKSGALDYGAGDRVKHIKFGVGTVVSVTDSGRDYEVLVNFDTAGPKKMFASFAKLKKL